MFDFRQRSANNGMEDDFVFCQGVLIVFQMYLAPLILFLDILDRVFFFFRFESLDFLLDPIDVR